MEQKLLKYHLDSLTSRKDKEEFVEAFQMMVESEKAMVLEAIAKKMQPEEPDPLSMEGAQLGLLTPQQMNRGNLMAAGIGKSLLMPEFGDEVEELAEEEINNIRKNGGIHL